MKHTHSNDSKAPLSRRCDRNRTTEQNQVSFKRYDNSLESKIRWVEPQHKFISSINSSSVGYNIINNCKTSLLPFKDISKYPNFANKKESHSKFIDYQSSNSDKICLAHDVY